MSETGTVFVVDDDAAIRRSLERLLRSAGYGTQTFDSARAFLASGRAQEPGCLVLDLRMPGVGGLELQHELDSVGCDIPIIFITGHGDVPAAVKAMRGGAVDMLTMPLCSRPSIEPWPPRATARPLDMKSSRCVSASTG
jgi:FixJ family two-component response regulator